MLPLAVLRQQLHSKSVFKLIMNDLLADVNEFCLLTS